MGIVLTINDINFVPLSSAKDEKKVNSQLSIKLFEINNTDNKLGYLLFLNMIPVPNQYLSKIDIEQIKKNDYKYYQLLIKQLIFIRREKKES